MDWNDTRWAEYLMRRISPASGRIPAGRSILWVGYPPLIGNARRAEYPTGWIPITNGGISAGGIIHRIRYPLLMGDSAGRSSLRTGYLPLWAYN